MATFSTTNIIFGIIGLGVIIGFALVLMQRRKKGKESVKRLKEAGEALTKDELRLKQEFEKKRQSRTQLRAAIAKRNISIIKQKLEDIEDVIDVQEQLVHNITKIDKRCLNHLKHIGISVRFAGAPVFHVSEVVKNVKTVWGDLDSQDARNAKLEEIKSDPDGISRNIKYLAMTMTYLDAHYGNFKRMYKKQRRLLRNIEYFSARKLKKKKVTDKDYAVISEHLMKFGNKEEEEAREIANILEYVKRLRHYTQELERAEAVRYKPFLVVEGHPVDIVTDPSSRRTATVGRKEKISIPNFHSDRIVFGRHANAASVVLHRDAADVHAIIRKNGGYRILAEKGAPTFVIRKHPREVKVVVADNADKKRMIEVLKRKEYKPIKELTGLKQKGLFTTSENLTDDDEIVLGTAYRFRFAQQ